MSDTEPEREPEGTPPGEEAPGHPQEAPQPPIPSFTRRLLQNAEVQAEELRRLRDENTRLRSSAMAGAQPADVEAIRAQVVAEAAARATAEAFNAACNDTYRAGVKEYGKEAFDAGVGTMRAAFNDALRQRSDILEVINDTEHGHRVYHALSKDLDAMAELVSLPPHKAALRIARMASELNKGGPPAAAIRTASRMPAPIAPISPSTRSDADMNDVGMSMEDFVRLRDKQTAERRRGKG
jgi:hypothetical protein